MLSDTVMNTKRPWPSGSSQISRGDRILERIAAVGTVRTVADLFIYLIVWSKETEPLAPLGGLKDSLNENMTLDEVLKEESCLPGEEQRNGIPSSKQS